MPRVFLACHDIAFCKKLRISFQSEGGFDVCEAEKNTVEAIQKAVGLQPDLVILETELSPTKDFYVAEAIKLIWPKVPLFLVTHEPSPLSEKEALSRGVDAVFEKENDLTSLLLNARAAVGLE
jgi:DNA-binding NarL/FixJ family response regulator